MNGKRGLWMAYKIIRQTIDLAVQDGCDVLMRPNVLAVKGDSHAHQWEVALLSQGAAVDLSGYTATCAAVNGGATTVMDATVAGNVVSVQLKAECYAYAGVMKCYMTLHATGRTPTMAMMCLLVRDGTTNVVIDPDDIIPNYAEIAGIAQEIATVVSGEQGRVAAEALRAAAEQLRADAETARGAAENLRQSGESAREDAEALRAAAESTRGAQETARASAELGRDASETLRQSGESEREATEALRAAAEQQRAGAETARGAAETLRQSGESTREATEALRAAAESTRGTQETARVSAELGRDAAETLRSQNEQARQEEIAKLSGMTVTTDSVENGTAPEATLTETGGVYNLHIETERGPQGDAYRVMGSAYTTVAALAAAITAPEVGDQYNVGAAAPYNVYRWTGATWEDQGVIQGTSGASAYELAVAGGYTGTEAEWLASLVGPTGDDGASAYEVAVAGGYTGTEAEWLASLTGAQGKTGVSGRNLLDNWDFRNPVNQRGIAGSSWPVRVVNNGVVSVSGYGLDRWMLISGSVTVNAGSITLNGTIAQISEWAWGTGVVASVMLAGGAVITSDATTSISYDDTTHTTTIVSAGAEILAAKLERGTVSTLADDPPMDYVTQLARCQRYQYVIPGAYSKVGTAVGLSSALASGHIPLPTSMRCGPTVTGSGVTLNADSVTCNISYSSGSPCMVAIRMDVTSGTIVAGSAYVIRISSNGGMIMLDANL